MANGTMNGKTFIFERSVRGYKFNTIIKKYLKTTKKGKKMEEDYIKVKSDEYEHLKQCSIYIATENLKEKKEELEKCKHSFDNELYWFFLRLRSKCDEYMKMHDLKDKVSELEDFLKSQKEDKQ
jgi:hypothetical protein